MLCKSCNTTNASTAKFCINCGLQLDSAVAAQEVKSPESTKHATVRENSESQKTKQNERLSTVQEIQFNQKSIDNEFAGEKTLTNDGYKIYLVKKHKIEKMDALGKFACGERLFETIEEALNFADSLENQTAGKSAATLPVPTQSVTANPEKNVAQETDNPPQNVRPQNTKHKKNKNALPIILGVAVIGAAVFWQMGTETERTTEKKDTVKPFTTKPYSQLRTEMGKEGWQPYIARDNKDQCDLKYQEVSFCSEDLSCTAEFVDGSNKQIATINFRICKSVINNCVSWGEYPDGFELVVSKELKSLNTPVETYLCDL